MLAKRETNISPIGISLADDLRDGRAVGRAEIAGMTVEAIAGRDHLWLRVRGPSCAYALRACSYMAGRGKVRRQRKRKGETLRFAVDSLVGRQDVVLRCHPQGAPVLELVCEFTPSQPMAIPFMPRDLYMLDDDGALGGDGCVEAAQRGFNSGLCFVRLEQPGPATLLYWQDLTALNAYFDATGTKPDGVVGGEWPELGFRLPTAASPQVEYPKPLPAGRTVTISRALVALHEGKVAAESDLARHFLTLSGAIYPLLEKPKVELREWRDRAERTAGDLKAPGATIRHYGHTYVHPYHEAEYPDSMTQTVLVSAMREWERARGTRLPLTDDLEAGIDRFFDPKLGALRRYLPNVGDDKNADAVDSWYLYYPLLHLARMGLLGHAHSRELYLKSIDFAIEAAQHFKYRFPIQYDINSFKVIVEARGDQRFGQTDVAGLYAYTMMLGFDLTGENRFIDEARGAMNAARGLRFDLNYQANLTAWGAAAGMRLWRTTADETWLDLSYIYLSSFLHNTAGWESEIDNARLYHNFLGATALHDAPYMAMLECSESFLAFQSYLHDSGPGLLPAARTLIDEYCRYVIDRAWFYFPDTLPAELFPENPRNGSIARDLSFPVEDLYVDGQQPGQVGQEIYGGGAAFIFASQAFHPIEGAPFEVFCDSFLFGWDRPTTRSAIVSLAGSDANKAMLALLPVKGARMDKVSLVLADGRRPKGRREGRSLVFTVPAGASVTLSW